MGKFILIDSWSQRRSRLLRTVWSEGCARGAFHKLQQSTQMIYDSVALVLVSDGKHIVCLCVQVVFYEAGNAAPGTRHQIVRKRALTPAAAGQADEYSTAHDALAPRYRNSQSHRSHLRSICGAAGTGAIAEMQPIRRRLPSMGRSVARSRPHVFRTAIAGRSLE